MTHSNKMLLIYQLHNFKSTLLSYLLPAMPDLQVEAYPYDTISADGIVPHDYDVIVMECDCTSPLTVELMRYIRQEWGETPIVLVTANALESKNKQRLRKLRIDRVLVNPAPNQVVETIQSLFEGVVSAGNCLTQSTDVQPLKDIRREITSCLNGLCTDTAAQGVLLLRGDGYLFAQGGHCHAYDIQSISALVAANVAAANELSIRLGNQEVFESNYHAGPNYNIYTRAVGTDYLLATIFGKESKLGVIHFYTQEAVGDLSELLAQFTKLDESTVQQFEIPTNEISCEVDRELDRLFQLT